MGKGFFVFFPWRWCNLISLLRTVSRLQILKTCNETKSVCGPAKVDSQQLRKMTILVFWRQNLPPFFLDWILCALKVFTRRKWNHSDQVSTNFFSLKKLMSWVLKKRFRNFEVRSNHPGVQKNLKRSSLRIFNVWTFTGRKNEIKISSVFNFLVTFSNILLRWTVLREIL